MLPSHFETFRAQSLFRKHAPAICFFFWVARQRTLLVCTPYKGKTQCRYYGRKAFSRFRFNCSQTTFFAFRFGPRWPNPRLRGRRQSHGRVHRGRRARSRRRTPGSHEMVPALRRTGIPSRTGASSARIPFRRLTQFSQSPPENAHSRFSLFWNTPKTGNFSPRDVTNSSSTPFIT